MEKKLDIWNMPQFLWNKVKEWMTDKAQTVEGQVDNPQSEDPQPSDNGFDEAQFIYDLQTKVLDAVKRQVKNKKILSNRILWIYIDDKQLQETALQHGWAERIADYVEDKWERVHSVCLEAGLPPTGGRSESLAENVELVIASPESRKQQQAPSQKMAILKMLYDTSVCKLVGDTVELMPEEGRVWYIGWETDTEVDNRPRKNEIALTYKEPEKQDPKVFMISRAHAFIKYSQGYWFLHVERGVRTNDERTKIERSGRVMELSDKTTGKPLKDRDVIRLNNEYLIFTIEQRQNTMDKL